MPEKRTTYHHGHLRAALIQAADDIIAEGSIESFSLRAAAQRAGVSPGAPAHHFGNATGLLTEVAILTHQRLGQSFEGVVASNDPAVHLRSLCQAFIVYAVQHPGHFRLMFRKDLLNRAEPRFIETGDKLQVSLARAVAAYHGRTTTEPNPFVDAADTFTALAMLSGMATLILEDKSSHFFGDKSTQEFLDRDLPQILERMYPNNPG